MASALTEAQKSLKEAKKEIARIKRFIREAEKRGYIFSESVIPPLPKVATAATVRKYKAITPKTLYKKAAYYDKGRKISGSTRRKQERKEAAQKGVETRRVNRALKVLNRVREIIQEWAPNPRWSDYLADEKEQDKNTLERVLEACIATEGEKAVAMRMEQSGENMTELTYAIIYGDSPRNRSGGGRSGVQMNMAKFVSIIYGKALSVRESMEYTEYGESDEYEDDLE